MITSKSLKWWCFRQNNSGGIFEEDDNVAGYVFIQEYNVGDAIAKAEVFCDNSGSCPCCGDRWSFWQSDSDGSETPMLYGKEPSITSMWMGEPNRFHYYDGRVTKVFE